MLQALIITALSLTTATTADAIERTPILKLANYPGYVHPSNAVATVCEVFPKTIEVTTYSQEGETKLVRRATIGGDLQAIIAAAAQAGLVHHVGPVDAPIVRQLAYFTNEKDEVQEVDLGSWLDGQITENWSLAANHLLSVLRDACGQRQAWLAPVPTPDPVPTPALEPADPVMPSAG